MKIRDLLEVAGDHHLKEFKWGDDVVSAVDKAEIGVELTLDHTGNQALSMIGEAIVDEYHNVLEDFLDLDVVDNRSKTEIAMSWGKFSLKVTLGTAASIGGLTAAYESIKTGDMPTFESLAQVGKFLLNFF